MPDERVVPMRLQRFLARSGVASRRGSEGLMTAGRVRVNGEVVTQLGSKVDPLADVVTVDGHEVRLTDTHTYLVLNKPAGYITTMSDPYGRPCVASLVPVDEHPGLFPVGRLDQDVTGVLLFTTDGAAAQEMLHPSHHVEKRYEALVEGVAGEAELDRLRAGVALDDGPCQPARARLLGVEAGRSRVALCVREGRKHQVKRMLEAVGHPVVRLTRTHFGPIEARGLARGSWRMLDDDERRAIDKMLGRDSCDGRDGREEEVPR